ncbi:hypothetical protein [Streptomyces sp. NPDC057438]|uniref:hypothetical protein n=1 Tax=Streptomyces sp. NPDC057438 TaxID=3346133 RepID=UPI00368B7A2A
MGIAVLVLVALALVLTAAGVLNGRSPDTFVKPSADAALTTLRNGLPLSGLLRSPIGTSSRVHEAEQRLVAACMSARGFQYVPAPTASGDSGTSPALFGIETLDAPSGDMTREPLPAERQRGEDFARALYGDPDRMISARNKMIRVTRPATGCLAEAQTRLLGKGGRARDLELRLQLDQGERDALQELEEDRAFRITNTRWKTCMARAGVTAKDPRQLAADLPVTADPATNSTARTDLTCKKRTGYLQRAYTRLAAIQQRWLDNNREPAAEWQALRLREDRAARSILKPL